MKIIGVGDNTVDVYLHQGKMYPGGNSVNVPVLCRKAGAEAAAYIGVFGDDVAGKLMYDSLKEEGLDISRVRVIHGQNSKNAITLNMDDKDVEVNLINETDKLTYENILRATAVWFSFCSTNTTSIISAAMMCCIRACTVKFRICCRLSKGKS